jgi:hypothetical protein
MQYWNMERFAAMGNCLGKFKEVDMSFKETEMMTVTKILVILDLREGML